MSRHLELLDLSYVRRWVVAPTHREQSVAEHTFRVLVIAYHLRSLVPELHAHVTRGELADAILFHDADERETGDVPGPVKSATPGYLADVREMSRLHCLVKVADSIETGTFWMLWGNPGAWQMHPYNQAPARDLRKINHYAAKVPGLLEAAQHTWERIMGHTWPTSTIS